jgi:hypothetical protein
VSRSGWDFDYAPVRAPPDADGAAQRDWVLATPGPADIDALRGVFAAAEIDVLAQRAPIYWTRIRVDRAISHSEMIGCLARAGIGIRYLASAAAPDLSVAVPLETSGAPPACAAGWTARARSRAAELATEGTWFLRGRGGVNVDRVRFSCGAGTRLAVIDNDAADADLLDLDAEVLVNVSSASRVSLHAAMMIGWAVGSRVKVPDDGSGVAFRGVAPDASPRLYCIPKPGDDQISLPMAIVRAADDGADVIVCATYVEGTTSPLLDDALEFAARLGRRGRGAVVILPTGREALSPVRSVHASFTLSLADPASDPRVMCVGPGGRDGAWFLWPDRKGKYHPFANRGPAVRWLAPGDDMAFPFGGGERLCHAESSGASAVAAGVVLLLMASNPLLRLDEIDDVLGRSVEPVTSSRVPPSSLADGSNVLPQDRDRDGHNAKEGYGRLNAARACMLATDPVAAVLVSIGEDRAALAYLDLRRSNARFAGLYSRRLGRWAARALLADGRAMHAAKVIVRHARLSAGNAERFRIHGAGAVLRHVALTVRALMDSGIVPRASRRVSIELAGLVDSLSAISRTSEGRMAWDAAAFELLTAVARAAAQSDALLTEQKSGALGPQLVRA